MRKILKGFTLIELMIALAIMAIVAAIAYPSYQNSVRKSRRADARAVLLQAAQFMERFYTQNFRYDRTQAVPPVPVALPANLQQSPTDGGTAYYLIALDPANPPTQNTFVLQATAQPAGGQNQDRCGGVGVVTLELNQAGQKGVNGAFNTPAIIQDCWR
ncbi:MAG TPA: type IV pilin protein [Candidatus Competibacteraceae bacterium]|nr:type IV pilin protein [Candidatus Competibacteraceae bacterium]